MTLKSALQDLRETTLAAISGLLGKLSYLASLRRREGGYLHWGLSLVHGEESSERALKAAQTEALSNVLRTPFDDGQFVVLGSSDDRSVVEALRYGNGLWEPHIMQVMHRYLRVDHVCFDSGANLGIYTLVMSKLAPEGSVVARATVSATYRRITARCGIQRDV